MSNFTLITLDTGLLGSYYTAQSNLRTLATASASSVPATPPSGSSPKDITPWANEGEQDSLLVSRYNKIRNETSFLDLNDEAVKKADGDADSEALFALYVALDKLKTIADYAADDNTLDSQLGRLSSQFNTGMKEVLDYVANVELDKLTLLAGEKKAGYESGIALGKDQFDLVGRVVSIGSADKVISGLNGTESFTLNISKFTDNDDIQINLADIAGDITLNSLVSHINAQIAAVKTLNSEGEEVGKYTTRFAVEEVSEGRFALKIDGLSSEKLTFTAAAPEPALYITGTTRAFGENREQATLSKLEDVLAPASSRKFTDTIAATDLSTPLPPLEDEDGNEIEAEQDPLHTTAAGTAVDSQGNVYILGSTEGDFDTQRNAAETSDVYLNKYDANGRLLWSRLVGGTGAATAYDIAIDGEDNVIIAGQADSELVSSDVFDGADSFVRKYDSQGETLWTRQLDTLAEDQANGLAIDTNGDIYVTGTIRGRLDSTTTPGGGEDIYVLKLSGEDGVVSQSTQIGGASTERGKAIAIASDGSILVASEEDGQAILRKLDAADLNTELASYALGDLGYGSIEGLAVEGGAIYLAGTTSTNGLSGGTVVEASKGGKDGFVTRLSDNGTSFTPDWTHFLGTGSADSIEDIVAQNGAVYVAGKTYGTLNGQQKSGIIDGFAAKLNGTTGALDWQHQLGGVTGYGGSTGIAFSQNGTSVLSVLGLPTGQIENRETRDIATQTTARPGDHFYISINGKTPVKVTIREGDTYDDLAKRIDRLSFSFIKATAPLGSEGPRLSIKAQNDAEIKIIAGKGAQDALAKLGMKPATILTSEALFEIGEEATGTDPDNLGGVFGLGIEKLRVLRTKQEAKYVAGQLEQALSTITRAYRSLTYDPIKAEILRQGQIAGQAPAHLTKQLANYQNGLNRLLAGGGASGASLFI